MSTSYDVPWVEDNLVSVGVFLQVGTQRVTVNTGTIEMLLNQ